MVGSCGLKRSIWVYVWWMELYGRQFWSMEVNPGVCLVQESLWLAVLVYGGQPVKYGGQVWCTFGAWKYVVRSFGLWRSTRLYFGAWNYVVGSFGL